MIFFYISSYFQQISRYFSISSFFTTLSKEESVNLLLQSALPDKYDEYSELFISPRDRYGTTAVVVDVDMESSPVKLNDIVLSIGVHDMPDDTSFGTGNIRDMFRAPHRILRVVATEGDIVKYNGIEVKIREGHCWVRFDIRNSKLLQPTTRIKLCKTFSLHVRAGNASEKKFRHFSGRKVV